MLKSDDSRRLLLVLSMAAALAGCGPGEPEWNRERQDVVTTRTYPGKSPDQVIRAAETTLRLAGGRDVKFEFRANGFRAERWASAYFIIGAMQGNYFFEVSARPGAGGAVADVRMYNAVAAITASGVFPGGGTLWTSEGAYRLIFQRMDHLLGTRGAAWLSCDAARAARDMPNYGYEPMCLGATDGAPD